jgi:hypothetical protein
MNSLYRIFSSLCAIVCLLIFVAMWNTSHAQDNKHANNPTRFTNEMLVKRCEASAGKWTIFHDGCADTCYRIQKENVQCPQMLRSSCDCGEDKCWDTRSVGCIENKTLGMTE